MSGSPNVEVIREFYDAFARGDVAAVLARMAPEIERTQAEGLPYTGPYKGPDSMLHRLFMKLATEWDDDQAVPDEFVAERDRVVALGQYSGTYKATGRSFGAPFAHVYTVRDGKIRRFVQHTDTAVVQKALQPSPA